MPARGGHGQVGGVGQDPYGYPQATPTQQAGNSSTSYNDPYYRGQPGSTPAGYGHESYAPPQADGHGGGHYGALEPDPYRVAAARGQQPGLSQLDNGRGQMPTLGSGHAVTGYGQGADAREQLRGSVYDDWQSQGAAGGNVARGYEPAYGQPGAQRGTGYQDWPQQSPYGEGGAGDHGFEAGADYGHAHGHGGQVYFDPSQGGALTPVGGHEDEEPVDEPAPARRRIRYGLIAAGLIGAIALGSGSAYLYKGYFSGSAGTEVATPVVKGDGGPAKTKPQDPGGKQFAHSDSKVMGRLSQDGSITTASTQGDGGASEPGAPRKVTSIPVDRNGAMTIASGGSDSMPGAMGGPAPPQSTVPGLAIVDTFGNRPPVGVQAPPPAQKPIVVNPPAAASAAGGMAAGGVSTKPIVIAKTTPTMPTAIDADAEPLAAATKAVEPAAKVPVAKKPPAAPKPKVVDAFGAAGAAVAPAAAPAAGSAAPAKVGASNYVAVLASIPASSKGRMDALKTFADMQQKYSVLADKTPDVQEANLGEKGIFLRLMAGPAGSKDQANSVCSQLKAAGYSGCWVTAH